MFVGNPGWLEPEEGLCPGWALGTIVLDKRSGLLVEIVDHQCDLLYVGERAWQDTTAGGAEYHSYRIRYFDDGTDPMDGSGGRPKTSNRSML